MSRQQAVSVAAIQTVVNYFLNGASGTCAGGGTAVVLTATEPHTTMGSYIDLEIYWDTYDAGLVAALGQDMVALIERGSVDRALLPGADTAVL